MAQKPHTPFQMDRNNVPSSSCPSSFMHAEHLSTFPIKWLSRTLLRCPIKPAFFMGFEMKPAVFVWSARDRADTFGWTSITHLDREYTTTSFRSAPLSQESFIVLHILKSLRCLQVGPLSSSFDSFCFISN